MFVHIIVESLNALRKNCKCKVRLQIIFILDLKQLETRDRDENKI